MIRNSINEDAGIRPLHASGIKEKTALSDASPRDIPDVKPLELDVKSANAAFFSLGPEKRVESSKTARNASEPPVTKLDDGKQLLQRITKLFSGTAAAPKLERRFITQHGPKNAAPAENLIPLEKKTEPADLDTVGVTAGPIGRVKDDQLVQAFRSSYAQSEPRAAGRTVVDPGILRGWILASALVFFAIISLVAARWIYTSPTLDKITSISDIANAFRTAKSAPKFDHPVVATADARDLGEMKKVKSNSRGVAPAMAPKVPTTPNRLQSATGEQVISGGGHVSLHPGPEVPERIVLPAYPAAALQKNIQGRVTLKAVISPQGTLRNIRLVSIPSPLSAAVMEAVSKWRYRPRIQNGMPIELETQISIDFER